MKKSILILIAIFALINSSITYDLGPKPSVTVNFTNSSNHEYYATLLSETPSYGPWSSEDTYRDFLESKDIYEIFKNYEDPDGFYFLNNFYNCTNSDSFEWSYYPPNTFKLLIYDATDHLFKVGPITTRKAFNSVYKVDLAKESIIMVPNISFTPLLSKMLFRIILTIIIEIIIGYIFGFKSLNQLKLITITNIITQFILHFVIGVFDYYNGPLSARFFLPLGELIVFIIEGFIYHHKLASNHKKTWLYTLIANFISMLVGFIL